MPYLPMSGKTRAGNISILKWLMKWPKQVVVKIFRSFEFMGFFAILFRSTIPFSNSKEYIFANSHFVKDSGGKDRIIDTQDKFLYTPGLRNDNKI
jgi:hypothetical protein